MDIVTSGLVGLAFVLLKTHTNTDMQAISINFLEKFIKKRFIFAQGIVQRLSQFLFANQQAFQYAGWYKNL